jgi:hypothetical protein
MLGATAPHYFPYSSTLIGVVPTTCVVGVLRPCYSLPALHERFIALRMWTRLVQQLNFIVLIVNCRSI